MHCAVNGTISNPRTINSYWWSNIQMKYFAVRIIKVFAEDCHDIICINIWTMNRNSNHHFLCFEFAQLFSHSPNVEWFPHPRTSGRNNPHTQTASKEFYIVWCYQQNKVCISFLHCWRQTTVIDVMDMHVQFINVDFVKVIKQEF